VTTYSTIKVTDQGTKVPNVEPIPSIADLVRLHSSAGRSPNHFAPSKRSNKNHSGRRNIKQARGREWEASVGGYKNLMRAIYAPPDKALCVTYEEWRRR
jgi:hypothetical protein